MLIRATNPIGEGAGFDNPDRHLVSEPEGARSGYFSVERH